MNEKLIEALTKIRSTLYGAQGVDTWVWPESAAKTLKQNATEDIALIDSLLAQAQQPQPGLREAVIIERSFLADIYNVAVLGNGCLPGHQMRSIKDWLEQLLPDESQQPQARGVTEDDITFMLQRGVALANKMETDEQARHFTRVQLEALVRRNQQPVAVGRGPDLEWLKQTTAKLWSVDVDTDDIARAIHEAYGASVPVAPIGVELAGVQRIGFSVDLQPWHRNFSEPLVIEIPDKNGQYVRFSDLEKLLPKSGAGWVSVKERLPEEVGEYLVWRPLAHVPPSYDPNRTICEYNPGRYGTRHQGFDRCHDVTHWQPLPSPPSDAGKEVP